MQRETIDYNGDGVAMRGELFIPSGEGRRAGVLVFPEAFGIGDHVINRAERLAELGYVALACDLHGNGRYIDDLTAAMKELEPLFADPGKTRARAAAALNALTARPEVDPARIAAIGFCFPMPLELARSGADIRTVVGFHTGLQSTQPLTSADVIKSSILVCIGGDDPYIPVADRVAFEAEMRLAEADWQIEVYGRTVHSFTNTGADRRGMPDTLRYSPMSDRRSWAAMLARFDEVLSPRGGRDDPGGRMSTYPTG
ncbi:dienelactone hydrolase family protein [Glacieibacterium megasporae]|uniref:dienelactone hydrolase family protein n=1 Tax=Glacieibacterium megasporae TaxID=2835787 RepID=UPI001C1E0678|nr:dienelactone hydrolase family protein [Polymorphobacter megasporae]UAJ12524.1 dienelactone hydrolase family protein [Polymorphobacter megasporae]